MRFSNSKLSILVAAVGLTGFCASVAPDITSDVQLRAMQDELNRAKTLQVSNLDKPYFIRYSIGDAEQILIGASLGGVTGSEHVHARHPQLEIRVGSYAFDNTNSTYSVRPNVGLAPVDDDYDALRFTLWLAGDGLYKTAAAQITAKRNALRNLANPDTTADFAQAEPVHILRPLTKMDIDSPRWEGILRRLSRRFADHPDLLASHVRLLSIASTYRLVNSEGSLVRVPQDLSNIEVQASGLTADGKPVRNSYLVTALRASELPSEAKLNQAVDEVAAQTEALRQAPEAEDYSGPVLFERQAAAQLMAELMADAARLTRKPVAPQGSNAPAQLESVWSSRLGSAVTPTWMSLEDDPTQAAFDGQHLAGHYEVDDEGVAARTVPIVEKGILKGFLMSREPVRNINGSNGHGRLPGPYEAEQAVVGNLFVRIDKPTSEAQMKQQLLEKVKTAGLKYGLLIRKLDFPSTLTAEELQGIGRQAQKSGYSRTITPPLLAFRVYPDGREELVRSVRFKEFSAKDLRDVAAAADHPYVLNYLNKGSLFNFADIGSDATTSSVICPSLLFESIETERADDEVRKPPVVPPPALTAQKQ